MRKFLLLIILLLPLLSCDKEADFRSGELQTPLVTGYYFTGEYGEPGPTVGKPNEKDFNDSKLKLFIAPNPAMYRLGVYLTSPSRTEAKVWLVQATMDNSLAASLSIFNATAVVIGGLPVIKADNIVVDGDTHLNLDVYNLPAGAYRLYVQIGDQLAWRNILKL